VIVSQKHLKLLLAIIGLLVFANVPAASKDFALHQAVLDQDIQLVKRLLSKGAAIDVIGSRKYGYGSALHLAVREGNLDMAKLLLDRGAEVDVLDPDDLTPLHNAAWNGSLEMTELLLDAGADIEASTYDGDTPLSLAQKNDQTPVAEFIQAKLQAPSVSETKVESTSVSDSGVRDVSGTYVMTNLTGNWLVSQIMLKPRSKDVHEVTIAQNGDQLTGTYDEGRGKFWGEIKGDTIKLDWVSRTKFSVNPGRLTFEPGSNDLSVTLSEHAGGEVKFNLTKLETETDLVTDISGTYLVDASGDPNLIKYILAGFKSFDIEGRPVFEIVQNGDEITVTISVGTREHGQFYGVMDGNTVDFKWEDAKGKVIVKPGGKELVGTVVYTGGSGAGTGNVELKLTKIDN